MRNPILALDPTGCAEFGFVADGSQTFWNFANGTIPTIGLFVGIGMIVWALFDNKRRTLAIASFMLTIFVVLMFKEAPDIFSTFGAGPGCGGGGTPTVDPGVVGGE